MSKQYKNLRLFPSKWIHCSYFLIFQQLDQNVSLTGKAVESVLENLGRLFLELCFLTLCKAWFLMSFPCRTLKIFVSHVTFGTKAKPHQGTARSFQIQYFILSVPLMGQKYENGGFVESIRGKHCGLHALLDTCMSSDRALNIDLPGGRL